MNKYLFGYVLVMTRPSRLIEPGWHISYAERNGGPLFVTEATWKNINGLLYSGKERVVWFYFRRRLS
jgi:hypothetical protein